MPRILCNWFPNWPIQRLAIERPELRFQKVVLFRRDARRGQLVSAVSPAAIRDGVAVDMPLSEAKSLLRRSKTEISNSKSQISNSKSQISDSGSQISNLKSQISDFKSEAPPPWYILQHDMTADQQGLEDLCDQLEQFSPLVGVANFPDCRPARPPALLLDITGLAHLFGSEAQLVNRQLDYIQRQGYLARVAVANTVAAAWGLARFFAGDHFRHFEEPLLAAEDDVNLLPQLPIAALRLDETTLDNLYQLGLRTVGQLQRLPRRDLAVRFGPILSQRLDQLTGRLEEPVQARRRPSEFATEQLLEHPVHHRETIEVVIQRLVAELCQQLRSQQQGALEWTIRLICQDDDPVTLQVKLFQPTATVEQVMPLVEMQLEQALAGVTRQSRKRKIRYTTIQVIELQVAVTSHVLLAEQQRLLFDDNPRLDRQALSQLINRLASRLGAENVVYPTLQSGAQPEYSFRLKPLVDSRRKRRRQIAQSKRQSHVLARPLRLFQPPIPLEPLVAAENVAASADGSRQWSVPRLATLQRRQPQPTGRNERGGAEQALPARTSRPSQWEGVLGFPAPWSQPIVASWGPERIETGWWRGRTVCRDYWRVETESGQQFWVFRSLRTGQWWLQGEF